MGNDEAFRAPEEHCRFLKVQYPKDQLNHSMLVHLSLPSKQLHLDPWIQNRSKYHTIYGKSNILSCQTYTVIEDNFCNDKCNIIMRFNCRCDTTLKSEIYHRSQIQRYYAQCQIWFLLLKLIKTAAQVYDNGDKFVLGNIHPNNILIDEGGDIKIIASNYSFSLPTQRDNFQQYRCNGDSHAYISPQLIGFLQNDRYPEYPNFPKCVDQQLSQTFTIGTTILAMATLRQNMSKIYNLGRGSSPSRYESRDSSSKYTPLNNSRVFDTSSKSFKSFPINSFIDQSKSIDPKFIESSVTKLTGKRFPGYNFKSLFYREYIQSLFTQMKMRYTPLLCEVVMLLMSPQPSMRITPQQLYKQLLQPNQGYILALDEQWLHQRSFPQQIDEVEQEGVGDNVFERSPKRNYSYE